MLRIPRSVRVATLSLTLALVPIACGSDERWSALDDVGGDAGAGATRHKATESVSGENLGTILATGGTSGTSGAGGGGTGGSGATGGGGNGAEGGTGGAGGADPTTGTSKLCGDGFIDPVTEECDDMSDDPADLCTRDCQARDVLALPPTGSITTTKLLEAHFTSGAEGFSLIKNAFFNSTGSVTYETGAYQAAQGFKGGGLRVDLGGQNTTVINDLSAGWRISFALTEPRRVGLFARMKLELQPGYENDEYGWAVVSLDGTARGLNGNNFIAELRGDGNGGPTMSTGWMAVQLDFGVLAVGTHTLTLGAYNNKKNAVDEVTTVLVDDVEVDSWVATDPTTVSDHVLGEGRHPLSGNLQGLAVAVVEPTEPPLVRVRLYTADGVPLGSQVASVATLPARAAAPVTAALPDGTFAVAYNDLFGDGDELGVALRKVVPGAETSEPLHYANETRSFSQANADMIWTGSELVLAWEDTSEAATAPDLKLRRFDAQLEPLSDETPLASAVQAEGDVALAPFAGGWAAAWRVTGANGSESTQVAVGAQRFTLGPHPAGAAEDRPALLELDATHLLVLFTVGTDPDASGLNHVPRLQAAVIDTTQTLAGTPVNISPLHPNYADNKLSQTQPAAVRVGNKFYVAWRSAARLSDAAGEELWLKDLTWSAGALGLTQLERRLARWPQPNDGTTQTVVGDQGFPALAASALPGGPALFAGWVDYGRSKGAGEGTPDVVVELLPAPGLRGTDPTNDCSWQAPCACGQGDCDDDTECSASCVCVHGKAEQFGLGTAVGLCLPAHCNNGAQDAGETGVDCGGTDCGTCLTCPASSANGTEDYCSSLCPCDEREADCDFDVECAGALECVLNRGDQYGFAAAVDVCVKAHCNNGVLDAAQGELRVDCGGPDCGACRIDGFCSEETKCHLGEGDCDADNQCDPGLVCAYGVGATWGYPAWADVCVDPTCAGRPNLPNSENYCSVQCPCTSGFGDCDVKNHCVGALACGLDNGPYFGQAVGLDMCVPTHCTNGVLETPLGELLVDCGGECGSQCPFCQYPAWFASFEDTTRPWFPLWQSASVSQTSPATQGSKSLRYATCGWRSIASPAFNTREWDKVGDELLLDVFIPNIASPPAWWGEIKVVINVPDAGVYVLNGGGALQAKDLTGLPKNQWSTVSYTVSPALKAILLQNHPGSSLRLEINWPTGMCSQQLLVDNLRFATNLTGQTNCYVPGSDAPMVVVALPLFSFDSVSQWFSPEGVTLYPETSIKTQGTGALKVLVNNGVSLKVATGNTFDANQLSHVTNQFNVDVRVPSGPSGNLQLYMTCPGGPNPFWEQSIGQVDFSSLTRNVFNHVRYVLPASVVSAFNGTSTGCSVRLVISAWAAGGVPFYFDNMGFVQP